MKKYQKINRIVKKILINNNLKNHSKTCFDLLSESLKLNPNFFGTHHLFGVYYYDIKNYKKSEEHYLKSIKLNPSNLSSYLNLITLYHKTEKIDNAIVVAKKVLDLEMYDSTSQIAMLYLLKGDFDCGWRFYNIEKKNVDWGEIKNLKKEVVVITEQGLGDNILFCRYGKLLNDFGINVSYAAPKKLVNLVKDSKIYGNVYDIENFKLDDNMHPIFLMDLIIDLNINQNNIVTKEPYLYANQQKINYWKEKIKSKVDSNKKIVGINWQGSKESDSIEEKDALYGRFISLKHFEILSDLENVQLISIQNGYGYEQLYDIQFKDKIIDFGGDLSIDDTAAIIMNCDYIVTTDTMVAHLSGALCKNTFILTLKVPHWIWGLNSEETLWYSSVKLCRQSINQNWDGVLERIKNELEQL